MRTVKADIIVLTWNQEPVIRDFVESFFANTTVPCRLIIIDNGSTDATGKYLAGLKGTETVELRIVSNPDNKGFVSAMNQGIALSEAPYVCLANNDLLFSRGWLEELVSIFEANPEIGVLNPYSNNLGAYPPAAVKIAEFAAGLHREFKGVFVEMPFCIGFCMFIRRRVIEKVGGLSPEFAPFYFEDSDYSLKAAGAGFLVGMAKGAYVWHTGHASLAKLGARSEEYFEKSRKAFQRKWGRTLRVLYHAGDVSEMLSALESAVRFARRGHYVWFAVKGLDLPTAEIFRKAGIFEHAGIKFINPPGISGLVWKILFKKKPFDAVVTGNGILRWIFSKMGYNIFSEFDLDKIDSLKIKKQ